MKSNYVKKLTLSALFIAIYIVIMALTWSISFYQYQLRIATSIYALSGVFPFLIIPLGLANSLSNVLFGGLGPIDWVGGFAVGILTSGSIYTIKKIHLNDWFITLPIILIPGLIVPIWLAPLIGTTYVILMPYVVGGQIIPGIVGVLLYKEFKKRIVKYK